MQDLVMCDAQNGRDWVRREHACLQVGGARGGGGKLQAHQGVKKQRLSR